MLQKTSPTWNLSVKYRHQRPKKITHPRVVQLTLSDIRTMTLMERITRTCQITTLTKNSVPTKVLLRLHPVRKHFQRQTLLESHSTAETISDFNQRATATLRCRLLVCQPLHARVSRLYPHSVNYFQPIVAEHGKLEPQSLELIKFLFSKSFSTVPSSPMDSRASRASRPQLPSLPPDTCLDFDAHFLYDLSRYPYLTSNEHYIRHTGYVLDAPDWISLAQYLKVQEFSNLEPLFRGRPSSLNWELKSKEEK